MNWKTGAAVYLLGALLTNSYCQVYRWDDWTKSATSYTDSGKQAEVEMRTALATMFWPVYWSSKACTKLVQ